MSAPDRLYLKIEPGMNAVMRVVVRPTTSSGGKKWVSLGVGWYNGDMVMAFEELPEAKGPLMLMAKAETR